MAANQFGIDVGQILGARNAFQDQQQRQQINALALQKGQMDLENAPELNALNLKSKKLEVAGQEQAQQIARHVYQTQQTVDALGALDAVPDDVLPQATSAVIAKLKSDGIDGADQLGQALASAGNDPVRLRAAVKQQVAAGMSYKEQLAQKNSDRTFTAQQDNTKAVRESTDAFRAATLAQGNERIKQNQEKIDQAKIAKAGADADTIKSYGENILNGNAMLQNVPTASRDAVSRYISEQTDATSPLGATRSTMAASRITEPFKKLPQYELTANGLPYLQRIDAAMKTPGSVSDQDLLDSLTKLNTAGNAITDAQVKIITDGKSFSDAMAVFGNKFKNGGVLSDNQRKQIQEIAKNIYANYKKGYQPVYDQATKQLKDAGIKPQFWTIPDLNKLSDQGGVGADQTTTAPGTVIDFKDLHPGQPSGPPQVPGAR